MMRVLAAFASVAYCAALAFIVVKWSPDPAIDWPRACGYEQRGYGECLRGRLNGFGYHCERLAEMPACHGHWRGP